MAKKLWDFIENPPTELSDVDSTAFLLKHGLSVDTYQSIRNVSKECNHEFLAPYYQVQKVKEQCLPENISATEDTFIAPYKGKFLKIIHEKILNQLQNLIPTKI